MTKKCSTCGNELYKKDYRKYGIVGIISGILMTVVLLFFLYHTILPYLFFVIHMSFSIYFLLKKERYFYYCKECRVKISHSDIEQKWKIMCDSPQYHHTFCRIIDHEIGGNFWCFTKLIGYGSFPISKKHCKYEGISQFQNKFFVVWTE